MTKQRKWAQNEFDNRTAYIVHICGDICHALKSEISPHDNFLHKYIYEICDKYEHRLPLKFKTASCFLGRKTRFCTLNINIYSVELVKYKRQVCLGISDTLFTKNKPSPESEKVFFDTDWMTFNPS